MRQGVVYRTGDAARPDEGALAAATAGRGKGDFFADLFARHRGPLYGYILHYLGNPADAEEAVQEVFVRLCLQLRRDSALDVRPWLYRTATNHCIDLLRARARHGDVGQAAPLASDVMPVATEGDPEGSQLQRERAQEVWRVLALLPAGYRQVLVLRQMQDLSYAEIAEVLGISVEAVTSLLHRARLAFRDAYRATCSDQGSEVSA